MFIRQCVRHHLYERIFGYNALCHFVQRSLEENKRCNKDEIATTKKINSNLYASTVIIREYIQRSRSRTFRNFVIPHTAFIPFLTFLNRYYEIQLFLICWRLDSDRCERVIEVNGCWEDSIVNFDKGCEFITDEIGEWGSGRFKYCKGFVRYQLCIYLDGISSRSRCVYLEDRWCLSSLSQ